jgi:hypothetical protein
MYVVELGTPFANGQPKLCPTCLKAHARKSLHLKLDANGDVFVTPGVLETLRTVFMAGLEITNEVEKPPPLSIGAVAQDKIYVLDHPLNKSLTAAPSYKPGRTKYESQARMRKTLERLLRRTDG